MTEKVKSGSRNVAIVGPYLSGKTTLLESLLFVTGSITRKGNVKDSNTIGDSANESRERKMSVEVSAATCEYNDVKFTLIDCPGSIEFAQETYNALIGVDAAIVVCEPITERVQTLARLGNSPRRFCEQNGSGKYPCFRDPKCPEISLQPSFSRPSIPHHGRGTTHGFY
jgi:elongation factor G